MTRCLSLNFRFEFRTESLYSGLDETTKNESFCEKLIFSAWVNGIGLNVLQ